MNSLRWKLTLVFASVILLTVLLTGGISLWATTQRFDLLVTEENLAQAEAIAPLAEASYAYWGDWRALDEIFEVYIESDTLAAGDFFSGGYISDVDWYQITADTIGIDIDTFWEAYDNTATIAEIAQVRGVDPEQIVQTILAAEENALAQAVAAGIFTPQQADDEVDFWREEIDYFVYEPDEPFLLEGEYFSGSVAEVIYSDAAAEWLLGSLFLGQQRLIIADSDGQVVYDSIGEMEGDTLDTGELSEWVSLYDPTNGQKIGTAIVSVGPEYYSAQQIAFLESVSSSLIWSGLAGGFIALIAGWLITKRIIAPVIALTRAAGTLAAGGWGTRLPIRSEDELGTMSRAFNQMAGELQNQEALRRRLVDDITHELNTPLSVIQLEVEALRDGMQPPKDAAANVVREIDRLQKLVQDLAILTEPAHSAGAYDMQPIGLGALTQSELERWQPKATSRDITLTLHAPAGLPATNADPARIAQVLANLLTNALRHTPAGGHIDIALKISASPEGQFIVTTITDSGAGIAPQDLPHIFDRFYRADPSRDKTTGGRGLGLSIVQQIIERHGGRVWVESTPGAGSVFSFSLPVLVVE